MRIRWWFRASAIGALAGAFWFGVQVTPTGATTMVQLSLDQLVQASSLVVRGRAIAQQSTWNAQRTEIVTLTTIAVEQAVKGEATGTVVVEQPGGRVGSYRVGVPGTVHFQPNTSYVLFLEPAPAEPQESAPHYLVVGLLQGAYRIYTDPVTGEERVIKPLGGVVYSNPQAQNLTADTLPLREFRTELESVLRTPLVIPAGVRLPLTVVRTEPEGDGRLRVEAQTTAPLFPNAHLTLPAGSSVEGDARLVDGTWKIRWNSVSVRGKRAPINGTSELTAGESLSGMRIVLEAR
ncbi:MAG: hypothetical protein ACLQOO_28115 [Terriglobia bacterium]